MSIASLALLLAANTVPLPVPVTAPQEQQLARWTPGPVRCGGTVIDPVRLSAVQSVLRWGAGDPRTVTLQFRIDADGRPLSIRTKGASFIPYGEDIAPALAASTFASGAAHADCRVDYRQQSIPLGQADPTDLIAYSLTPSNGPLPRGMGADPPGGYRLPAPAPARRPAARLPRFPQDRRQTRRTAMVDDRL